MINSVFYSSACPQEQEMLPLPNNVAERRKTPSSATATIQDIPNEILLKIFSFLDDYGWQQVNLVDRRWNELSRNTAIHEKIFHVKEIAFFLNSTFPTLFTEWCFSRIEEDPGINLTLIEIKSLNMMYKEIIYNALKHKNDKEIKDLEKLINSNLGAKSFNRLFEYGMRFYGLLLDGEYKQLSTALHIANYLPTGKNLAIEMIVEGYLKRKKAKSMIECAETVAEKITCETVKGRVLRKIAINNILVPIKRPKQHIFIDGWLDKSLNIVDKISAASEKELALLGICEVIREWWPRSDDKCDKFNKVAELIRVEENKEYAFLLFAKKLASPRKSGTGRAARKLVSPPKIDIDIAEKIALESNSPRFSHLKREIFNLIENFSSDAKAPARKKRKLNEQ